MPYLNITLDGTAVNILSGEFLGGLVILVINAGLLFLSLFLVFKSGANLFARRKSWLRKLVGSFAYLILGLVVFLIFTMPFIVTNTYGSWDFEIQQINDPYDLYEVEFRGFTYRFSSTRSYYAYFRLTAQEANLLSEKLEDGLGHSYSTGSSGSTSPPDDPVLKAVVELWPDKFPEEIVEYFQNTN